MFQADLIPCKKYQIDWRKVYDDGSYDPVEAILINPADNPECQAGGSFRATTTGGGGGGGQAGPQGPPVAEPGTVMLIAAGMACLARRRRRSSRI